MVNVRTIENVTIHEISPYIPLRTVIKSMSFSPLHHSSNKSPDHTTGWLLIPPWFAAIPVFRMSWDTKLVRNIGKD